VIHLWTSGCRESAWRKEPRVRQIAFRGGREANDGARKKGVTGENVRHKRIDLGESKSLTPLFEKSKEWARRKNGVGGAGFVACNLIGSFKRGEGWGCVAESFHEPG